MTDIYAPRIRKVDDRPTPVVPEPKNGTEAIRQKLIACNKRVNLAGLAVEVGLAPNQLDSFIEGRSVPSAAVLCKMAQRFWPHAKFDPDQNVLIAGTTEYTPLGVIPGNFIPDERCVDLVAAAAGPRRLRSEVPENDKPRTRPGWLNSWFGA
jgi:hypothetical protein